MKSLVYIFMLVSGLIMVSCGSSPKVEEQPVEDSVLIDSVSIDSCDSLGDDSLF